MRPIGEIDNETDAKRFGDYLYANGTANDVDEDDGTWTLWVHDDDLLAQAEAELGKFLKDPKSSRYTKGARNAVPRVPATPSSFAKRKPRKTNSPPNAK